MQAQQTQAVVGPSSPAFDTKNLVALATDVLKQRGERVSNENINRIKTALETNPQLLDELRGVFQLSNSNLANPRVSTESPAAIVNRDAFDVALETALNEGTASSAPQQAQLEQPQVTDSGASQTPTAPSAAPSVTPVETTSIPSIPQETLAQANPGGVSASPAQSPPPQLDKAAVDSALREFEGDSNITDFIKALAGITSVGGAAALAPSVAKASSAEPGRAVVTTNPSITNATEVGRTSPGSGDPQRALASDAQKLLPAPDAKLPPAAAQGRTGNAPDVNQIISDIIDGADAQLPAPSSAGSAADVTPQLSNASTPLPTQSSGAQTTEASVQSPATNGAAPTQAQSAKPEGTLAPDGKSMIFTSGPNAGKTLTGDVITVDGRQFFVSGNTKFDIQGRALAPAELSLPRDASGLSLGERITNELRKTLRGAGNVLRSVM